MGTLLRFLLLAILGPMHIKGQDCNKRADLFFVIDGSESVRDADFLASKQFVIDVLEDFEVRLGAVHVGANVFGTQVYDGINIFGPTAYPLLQTRIRTLQRSILGTTRTNLAIRDMREQFQIRGRDNVTWIGVVITDGKSVDIQATANQASQARAEGINMIAVGVGEVFRDPAQAQVTMAELINIAGDVSSVRQTLDISALVTEIQTLMKNIVCPPAVISTKAATTKPVTTTPSTDNGQTDGVDCTDCMIDEHHGYWKHPITCEKFIRIYSDGNGNRKTVTQRCEPGLFWDQSLLTCVRPELVDCENDPCKNRAVASYDVESICNAFIQCINGKSYRSCCPLNHRYVAGSGCVLDPTCAENCHGGSENSLLAPEECPSVRHPTMKGYFIENVPGHGNITRKCPERTEFDGGLCVCNIDENTPITDRLADCNSEASFPFTSDFSDVSGNRLYAGTQLVSIEDGTARFNGNGMVNIYRFSKDSFGEGLTIRLKFKSNAAVGTSEALLTNCIFGSTSQASVSITVVRASPGTGLNTDNYVVFRSDTNMATQSFSIPYNPSATNELVYVYDGSYLTGSVNGIKEQRPLSGRILLTTSGIIIGAGSKLSHFTGNIGENASAEVDRAIVFPTNNSEEQNIPNSRGGVLFKDIASYHFAFGCLLRGVL